MTNVNKFDPSVLKPGWVTAAGNLKPGAVTPAYSGGVPSDGDLKPGLVNSSTGDLREGLIGADGELKPSMTGDRVLPSFTVQPTPQEADIGETATYISVANGTPNPTYQWQLDTGGGFSNISGATSSTFTTPTLNGDDGNLYRVVATNSEGSATSDSALLTMVRTSNFFVDPDTGSDANPGTEGSPFATIRFAFDSGVAGAIAADRRINVKVVAGSTLQTLDHFRFDADWDSAISTLGSTVPGVPFIVPDAAVFLFAIGDCKATVTISDATVTCGQISEDAASVTDSEVHITLEGSCSFTHINTLAVGAIQLKSAFPHSITIRSGVSILGWSALTDSEFGSWHIDGMVFNAGSCLADQTSMRTSGNVTFINSTYIIPNSGNNQFSIRSEGDLALSGSTIEISSTATVGIVDIRPPAVNGETSTAAITNNDITIDSNGGQGHVLLGYSLNTGITRAANNALFGNFSSLVFDSNTVTQLDGQGGVVRMMVGTDGATGGNNTLLKHDTSTNVHEVYFWGDGIQFTNNFLQSQILAFGPNQVITDNVVVGRSDGILLGGTQGGSTTSGGGNNYTITGNIFVSEDGNAFDDYADANSYPTNLGELVADVNGNIYASLAGLGVTLDSTVFQTPEALETKWDTWGDGNGANSSTDHFATPSQITAIETIISEANNQLDRGDLEAIKAIFS